MIDLIKSVILGIIEGITEWLPISSTGHLVLADQISALSLNVRTEFKEVFDVVIQLGAILAVVVIYWQKLWPLTKQTESSAYKICKNIGIKKKSLKLWLRVAVACIPCVVVGLPIDNLFFDPMYNDPSKKKIYATIVAMMLVVYGIAFIVVEKFNKNKEATIISTSTLTYKTAFLIGCFQALAIIPGTSRSGATILGAMILGASRSYAAEFSFFLSVPVMFGASLLKLLKFGFNYTGLEVVILAVGMITAFVVSIVAIKFLIGYIKKKDFTFFGWYRIVLGAVVLFYFGVLAK